MSRTMFSKGLCGLLLAILVWWVLGGSPITSDDNKPLLIKKMPSLEQRLPDPRQNDHITVLSIDGGGIRGLIPAVILEALENELKDLEQEGSDVRIADYFDVIAGTSTGGLIAAMLTTPDPDNTTGRPKTANQIKEYYLTKGPKIFSPRPGWLHTAKSFFPGSGPRYDGTFLRKEIERITGGNTLADTLTSVVIPAFDVSKQKTIIFSSFKSKPHIENGPKGSQEKEENGPEEQRPLLSDVCIATTAAPTYFPAHHFPGAYYDYDLIDGGVGANNPTMVAISSITNQVLLKNDKFEHYGGEMNYRNMVVISIGTGSPLKVETPKDKGIYKAKDCAKWAAIDWIWNDWGFHRKPIIDMLMRASDFLVDYHVATLLQSQGCDNYLRIQALGVDEGDLSIDNVTDTYMCKLVDKISKKLLDNDDVYEVAKITGVRQVVRPKTTNKAQGPPTGTNTTPEKNRAALKRYAVILKTERDKRLKRTTTDQANGQQATSTTQSQHPTESGASQTQTSTSENTLATEKTHET